MINHFHSKVGYSLSYKKKELLTFISAYVLIALLIYVLFPEPANGFFVVALSVIFAIFIIIGVLLMKWVLGVTVTMDENKLHIFSSQAFMLKPKENELYFTSRGSGACVITKDNIVSARPLHREDLLELKRLWNVPLFQTRTRLFRFPWTRQTVLLNANSIFRLAFVADWSNIVLLKLGYLDLWDPTLNGSMKDVSAMKREKKYELLVSVNDPSAFCAELSKDSSK